MKTLINFFIDANAAKEILSRPFPHQRPLSRSHVSYLVGELKSGNFSDCVNPIVLSTRGECMDGQHRLSAIVQSGIGAKFTLIVDAPDKLYAKLGGGKGRSIADCLQLVDGRCDNATVIHAITSYLNDAIQFRDRAPLPLIQSVFQKFPKSWEWMATEFRAKVRGLTRAPVMAAIAIYHSVDPDGAAQFANGFKTGENLSSGSPELALIKTINSAALGKRHSVFYWKAVAATRAHLEGREVVKLYEATVDLLGNSNPSVLSGYEDRAKKAMVTRRATLSAAS